MTLMGVVLLLRCECPEFRKPLETKHQACSLMCGMHWSSFYWSRHADNARSQ